MLCTAEDYRKVYPLGTWRHNPWTGTRRDDRDIGSDPKGLLIQPPGEEMIAATDWITWQGTCACPTLPDVLVDVQWHNGEQTLCRAAGRIGWGPGVKAYRLSELGALKSAAIRDTNTIVNAFARGGAADQMAAAAHSVGEAIDKHVKAAQEVRKNQLWKNKAVRQNIVRIVSVEPHRVLVERADGQRYFVARDKLHVHWSLHGVDVNSPEYMAAQRRLTQLLTEEHDDAVLDATKVNIMGDLLVESQPAAVKTLMSLGYRYEGGEMWVPPIGKALPFSAPDLLDAAAGHMRDRAATYDKPEGERSMGKTVQAFNAITGRSLDVVNKIQSMLVALKAVFETRGDDSVAVEMIDGLLVYAKDMKPVLRESEGWLLMAVLKMVRSEQRGQPHRDSLEDLIAYAALFGEARVGGQ